MVRFPALARSLVMPRRLARTAVVFCVLAITMLSTASIFAASASWKVNGDGNWSDNANWTAAYPNGLADDAIFGGDFRSGDRTVTLDADRTVRSLVFDATTLGYTLDGSKALTLAGSTGITQNGSAAITIGVSSLVMGTSQTWTGNGSGLVTVSSAITSPWEMSLTKTGTFTLLLTGKNTFSGPVHIAGGVLRISNSQALGTAGTWGNTISSGASLELLNNIRVDEGGFAIAGTGVAGSGAIRNISGNNTLGGQIALSAASSITSTAGTLSLSGYLGVTQDLTLGGAGNITLSGSVNGTSNLIKEGTGTLTYSGSSTNTLSGTTFVNSGTAVLAKSSGASAIVGALVVGDGSHAATVRLDANNQIADDVRSPITINNGSVLNLNGHNEAIHSLTMSGGAVTTGAGTLTLANAGSGVITTKASGTESKISGKLALGAYSHGVTVDDGSAANDLDISATISGVGTTNLIKDGAGVLRLSSTSNNSFTGNIVVNEGTLRVSKDGHLGNSQNDLTLNGGTLNTTSSFELGSSRVLTLEACGGTVLVDAKTTFTLEETGQLTGSGSLTKTGAGTLAIDEANTGYRGATAIDGGTVTMGDDRALGTGDITLSNGAKLELDFTNTTSSYTGVNVTINDGTISRTAAGRSTTGLIDADHTLTVTGNATIIDQGGDGWGGYLGIGGAVNVLTGATLTATASGTNDQVRFGFDQPITVAAGATFATSGKGSVQLGNSYSRTLIGQGTSTQEAVLRLGAASTTYTGSYLQVDGSGTGGLRIEGTREKVGALVSDSLLAATRGTGGTLTLAFTDGGTRTIGRAANLSTRSSILLGLDGGTFSLGSTGGSTGDLSNWGGLVVGDSATVLFNDDFVFSATADLTMLGGTLALNGTSQAFDTLSVLGKSVLDFGGGASELSVTSLSIADGATLTITNWTASVDYFLSLLDPGTTNLSQIVFANYPGGSTHWQNWDNQVTPVPEPATYGMLLIGSGLAFFLWRRKSGR